MAESTKISQRRKGTTRKLLTDHLIHLRSFRSSSFSAPINSSVLCVAMKLRNWSEEPPGHTTIAIEWSAWDARNPGSKSHWKKKKSNYISIETAAALCAKMKPMKQTETAATFDGFWVAVGQIIPQRILSCGTKGIRARIRARKYISKLCRIKKHKFQWKRKLIGIIGLCWAAFAAWHCHNKYCLMVAVYTT